MPAAAAARAYPDAPLARRLGRQRRPLQMQLQPGVAPAEAMIPHQMLVECLTVKP